jgi:hypothetical protein
MESNRNQHVSSEVSRLKETTPGRNSGRSNGNQSVNKLASPGRKTCSPGKEKGQFLRNKEESVKPFFGFKETENHRRELHAKMARHGVDFPSRKVFKLLRGFPLDKGTPSTNRWESSIIGVPAKTKKVERSRNNQFFAELWGSFTLKLWWCCYLSIMPTLVVTRSPLTSLSRVATRLFRLSGSYYLHLIFKPMNLREAQVVYDLHKRKELLIRSFLGSWESILRDGPSLRLRMFFNKHAKKKRKPFLGKPVKDKVEVQLSAEPLPSPKRVSEPPSEDEGYQSDDSFFDSFDPSEYKAPEFPKGFDYWAPEVEVYLMSHGGQASDEELYREFPHLVRK